MKRGGSPGAGGSAYSYFGHDDWRAYGVEVKSIESALAARSRLLAAFEAAEATPHAEDRDAWLTFVVVGAGATGVELAGALGEIAHATLKRDFRASARGLIPRAAAVRARDASERRLSALQAWRDAVPDDILAAFMRKPERLRMIPTAVSALR